MDKAKPFCIAKHEVWEAYKRVKANRGAAGVDEQSIAEFDEDLSNNLYRIWNRMSSGSYQPRPVRRVDIDKGDGRKRPLGIPTVSDRIAQTVVPDVSVKVAIVCVASRVTTPGAIDAGRYPRHRHTGRPRDRRDRHSERST